MKKLLLTLAVSTVTFACSNAFGQLDHFGRMGLGVPKTSKPFHSEITNTINQPHRVAFPSQAPDYLRSFYQSRSNQLFMVGTVLLDMTEIMFEGRQLVAAPSRRSWLMFKINQHVGNGLYLVNGNEIALDVGDPTYAEGETLSGMALEDGLYRYVSVLGAPRQIAKMKFYSPRPATFEEFLAGAKAGGEFKIVQPRPVTCGLCEGTKTISASAKTSSGKPRPMQTQCTECKGAGKVSANVGCVMVWKP